MHPRSSSGPTQHAHRVLTVGYGLHAEAQQCMQEVHNVIERVFVDVLAHCLPKLHLVQLVKAGQAVLGLEADNWKQKKRRTVAALARIHFTFMKLSTHQRSDTVNN